MKYLFKLGSGYKSWISIKFMKTGKYLLKYNCIRDYQTKSKLIKHNMINTRVSLFVSSCPLFLLSLLDPKETKQSKQSDSQVNHDDEFFF